MSKKEHTSKGEAPRQAETGEQGERLSRYLAHAGIASRRQAEELIATGRVQVNGVTVTTQGVRVDPNSDRIVVNGQSVVGAVEHVYLLLHKPAGYVSTSRDPQHRPTVLSLLPPEIRKLRVYSVGRLDVDTSGLLLLSNDGDFTLRLTHPRYNKEKRYEVLIQGHPTPTTLERLRNGVEIREDNGQLYQTSAARVRILRTAGVDTWLELIIHEGHKRQIRRMLEAVGHRVRQLIRVGVGDLTLKGVAVGKWRYLTEVEVRKLLE